WCGGRGDVVDGGCGGGRSVPERLKKRERGDEDEDEARYGYIKNHKKTVKKRASTDTRIRRVQKEAKESKPKPEKLNPQSNPLSLMVKSRGKLKLKGIRGGYSKLSKQLEGFYFSQIIASRKLVTQAKASIILEKAQKDVGFAL
ncbi:hypothetical protein Tco_0740269, partial [Tanacetum coccineum]